MQEFVILCRMILVGDEIMRKIMYGILFLILIVTSSVSAGTNDTKVRVEYQKNIYGNFVVDGQLYWNQIGIVITNDRISFCLEPGIWITENIYDSYTDFNIKNISPKQKRELELYVYYGYEYAGHTNNRYYLATQELIWRNLGLKELYWTTEANHGGEIIDVSEEKNEILRLIKTHQEKPSFHGKVLQTTIGNELIVTDEKNLLDRFEVKSSNDFTIKKDENRLKIVSKSVGKKKIELKYHATSNKTSLLFTKNNSQALATLGLDETILSEFYIESTGYELTVYKKDYDTKTSTPSGKATLEGAVYGIYQNGEKISEAVTDADGKLTFANLGYGKYVLKEITPSEGYELDDNEYEIVITEDRELKITKEVYEHVIENEIEIAKVYASGTTGILKPEQEITFAIYNSEDELVKEITTNNQGIAKAKLPYGTYRVHQNNTSAGYEKVDDFFIHVTARKEEPVRYFLSDAKVNARIKIVKVDEYNTPIKKKGITFKIKNMDTGNYVEQILSYPMEQKISVFETNEQGEVTIPLPIEAGRYQIEEIKGPDGYLPLNEPVGFTLDENSNLEPTETGNILQVQVVNHVPKGQLVIKKQGIMHQLQKSDQKFTIMEQSEPLSNVLFEVIADEDIKVNGKLIYPKGTKVEEVTTLDGIATTSVLPLGNYCIKETLTEKGYELDPTPYCITLKWDAQSEVVVQEFHLSNRKLEQEISIQKNGQQMKNIENNEGIYEQKPLMGIKFSVFTKEDIQIGNELIKAGTEILSGTTDQNGLLKFSGLPLGSYLIKEENLEEYKELDTIESNLTEYGQKDFIRIVNEKKKGNVLLVKTDATTGKKLSGATFKIVNREKQIVYEKKLDESGILELSNLEYGTYDITEQKAPQGYSKTKNHYLIKIDGSKETYALNIKNNVLKLPNTSSIKRPVLIFFGILGSLTLISFIGMAILKHKSYE